MIRSAATSLVLLAACQHPLSAPPAAQSVVADRQTPADSSTARSAQGELIVGSPRGLEAWARDGSAQRRVSLGPALHPRWLDADHILTLKPLLPEDQRGFLGGAWLERISLRDGTRAALAQLPGFQCANAPRGDDALPAPSTLGVQDASDFEIAPNRRSACIVLMDRNINMVDVRLGIRVDLTSAAITRWLDVGEPECMAPAGVLTEPVPQGEFCDADSQRREAAPAPDQFPFAFEDETLWRRSPDGARAALLQVQEYDVELTSPSGRWDLLSGDAQEADYIYRRLILLDRETGQLYPIPGEAGAWPPPLTAARVSPLPRIPTPIEQTVQIWGEVDVRWLGASADTELLVIGEQVVRPGQLRFSVDGEIAR